MELPVLIEPVAGNGYRAQSGSPLALTAEGATSDEALRNLQQLVQQHLRPGVAFTTLQVPGSNSANPWVEFAGMFKDDPYYDEWQEAIAENRRKADQEPDLP